LRSLTLRKARARFGADGVGRPGRPSASKPAATIDHEENSGELRQADQDGMPREPSQEHDHCGRTDNQGDAIDEERGLHSRLGRLPSSLT
jgi:hypothetical protein